MFELAQARVLKTQGKSKTCLKQTHAMVLKTQGKLRHIQKGTIQDTLDTG